MVVDGTSHTLKGVRVPVARGVAGSTVIILIKVRLIVGAHTPKVDLVGNKSGVACDTGESMGVPEGRGIAGYAYAIFVNVREIGGTEALLFLFVVNGVVGTTEALPACFIPVVRAGAGNTAVVGSNELSISRADT